MNLLILIKISLIISHQYQKFYFPIVIGFICFLISHDPRNPFLLLDQFLLQEMFDKKETGLNGYKVLQKDLIRHQAMTANNSI